MKNFIQLSDLSYFDPIDGLKAKIVHTESQTYAFWEIDEGTTLPKHKHMHEQMSIVTKGELELTIDGEMTLLNKGSIAFIPSDTNHSAKAITQVELIDVFTPIREDFPNFQT